MKHLAFSILALLLIQWTFATAEVVVVREGKSTAAIHVAAAVMDKDKPANAIKPAEREAEVQRQRLRESVKDLAHYLEKISGGKVEIVPHPPVKDDPRVHIYVGGLAQDVFGPVGKQAPFKQGFRMVVSDKGIGLYGESDLASSYAIYELLDRLGCRWYMPSEMGEVIPKQGTIALKEIDFKSAPGTIYRGVWYADDAYRRRNRHGGLLLNAGHALEMYITKEERAKHPEWVAEIGGKPHPVRLKWSNAKLAEALGDKILATHATNPATSYSLSPDDGADFDESKEDKALDAGDFDTTCQMTSITDRFLVLCNRVAERVTAKQPDVLFGVLAYVQYTRPPKREKVHPSVVPQIAPITYSRAHPMTDDRVPGNKDLRYIIEGWGKAAKMISVYFYAWFLAEPVAPNPMLTKWGTDVPIVLRNNCQFWQPETISNFETSMHALYLGCRLAWDPQLKPDDVIAEINTRFYGNAAKEMTAYWKFIDDVWVQTPEYSGCGFAYLRRWTPERMQQARKLMEAALAACKEPIERQRVELANDSLKLFELFMKLRNDQAEGRFDSLASEAADWRKQVVALGEKYKDQYTFTRVPWTPHTVNGAYFGQFYQQTYDDATRVAKNFTIVGKPIRNFRYQPDKDKTGESMSFQQPKFDDKAWKTTDVCLETWSTLGHHDWFKSMWYRTEVELPELPQGKKVFLWIGSTDGSAKVFVNGKHVPYADAKGMQMPEFNGYCQPASFDITSALQPKTNQVSILCTRTFFNELGTGGLLSPVVIYREK